ncbi:hypothetical protein Sjap_002776 [Stephania japonica]|uniref:Uncharacterized protein n=1 Tax=Stephania japonica TaxID=461633 RepID=A0AAP0KMP8_9MAGN
MIECGIYYDQGQGDSCGLSRDLVTDGVRLDLLRPGARRLLQTICDLVTDGVRLAVHLTSKPALLRHSKEYNNLFRTDFQAVHSTSKSALLRHSKDYNNLSRTDSQVIFLGL